MVSIVVAYRTRRFVYELYSYLALLIADSPPPPTPNSRRTYNIGSANCLDTDSALPPYLCCFHGNARGRFPPCWSRRSVLLMLLLLPPHTRLIGLNTGFCVDGCVPCARQTRGALIKWIIRRLGGWVWMSRDET